MFGPTCSDSNGFFHCVPVPPGDPREVRGDLGGRPTGGECNRLWWDQLVALPGGKLIYSTFCMKPS